MSLQSATSTRSTLDMCLFPLIPESHGKEMVSVSPGTEEAATGHELQSAELMQQMFMVINSQNEGFCKESEKTFLAFKEYQKKMKEELKTLMEENGRCQAELATSTARYNELKSVSQTETAYFLASVNHLNEEVKNKNEQITHLEKKVKELEAIKTLYQNVVVENVKLKTELMTSKSTSNQQIAVLQAEIKAVKQDLTAHLINCQTKSEIYYNTLMDIHGRLIDIKDSGLNLNIGFTPPEDWLIKERKPTSIQQEIEACTMLLAKENISANRSPKNCVVQ
jgi:predicted RNase H-like nuclease (RuvC/YqgF family)